MSSFLVHKCVCHDIEFTEIKKFIHENRVQSVKGLQAVELCSTKCKMCEPYVELVLKTGETEFQPGAYNGRKKSS